MQTLAQHDLPISSEDDISLVRRKVKEIAKERGFDSFAVAAVTTATSELTRNAWTHGGGGAATISEITDGSRIGIRAEFRDEGPGIPDVERAMQGGFSTRRSLGLGLTGTRRLVDELDIDTTVGKGTVVSFIKWKRA